jgi:hypothetical protein
MRADQRFAGGLPDVNGNVLRPAHAEIGAVVTQMARPGHSRIFGTSELWESEEQAARPPLGPGDVRSAVFGGGRVALAARRAAPPAMRSSAWR